MKKELVFVGLFLFSVIFVSLIVSAQNNNQNPDYYFYCHDSDDRQNKDTEGIGGRANYFERGETYGRERLYSDDFVTKEDFCAIREEILLGPTRKGPEDKPYDIRKVAKQPAEVSGATLVSYGERGSPEERKGDYIFRCAGENCTSAKRDSCEGENCGVLEYYCGIRDSFGDWFKFYLKHPIEAMSGWFDDNINYNVVGTISLESCEFGCSDGACLKMPTNQSS